MRVGQQGQVRRRAGAAAALLLAALPLTATAPLAAPAAGAGTPDAPARATDWAVPAAPVTLAITTAGAAPITSKDDYVAGTMDLAGTTHQIEIKGRGNSTWNWPKKPYKIKLAADAGLLGMPEAEEWVLLANYADRTGLRNHLALRLGDRTRLPWSPRTRFVDVVLNGTPQGQYLLTEQVEQGADRVDLPEGGYLLEIDQKFRASGDPGFKTRLGTPVSYKDPDELTEAQKRQVKHAVRRFETVLYGDHFADAETGYPAYIDVDSVIDWYLVEELFRNQDSNFYSSVNVTWVPGRGFAMGPVWDFDLSAGTKWKTVTQPQGWHTRLGTHWVARMFEDPAFAARVKARWAELRPVVDSLLRQLPAAADVVRPSALADWAIWPTRGPDFGGSIHADTFDGEVTFLREWLAARAAWMSHDEVVFGRHSRRLRERDTVLRVPVRVLGTQDRPVTVRYALGAASTASQGTDFAMSDATLTFGPGESVKSFPVRILGDADPEPEETIVLELSTPEGSSRPGDPGRITFTLPASDQRPDLLVREPHGDTFAGDGVYNATGRGQTRTAPARPGQRRTFRVLVANDGNAPSTYAVRGRRIGRPARLRYIVGGRDVTRQVQSRQGWRVELAPGEQRQVRVLIAVRRGAGRARAGATVSATWRGDRTRVDAVRALVAIR